MGGVGVRRFSVFVGLLCCAQILRLSSSQLSNLDASRYDLVSSSESTVLSEIQTLDGGVLSTRLRLKRGSYILREDLIVDEEAHLIVEPGVRISFAPTVGITVRGVLTAKGLEEDWITFTSEEFPNESTERPPPNYRLVDGSSILSGRLQSFYNGKWRSVCSNSLRWSTKDIEVVCREMGWLGGGWIGWMDREPGFKPRLLISPNCTGTENRLSECENVPRQLGGPTCDFHPDIAIECYPQHVTSSVRHNWRGIRFENAKFRRTLTLSNTFYVPFSSSSLRFVNFRYTGSGQSYNTSSAIEVTGVAPEMVSISISNSAYNGINITEPIGPVYIYNSSIVNNRGYGIYVNSSDGGVHVEGGNIADNGGDGIRYVGHKFRLKDRENVFDLCTLPTTSSQTFPLLIEMHQSIYSANRKSCEQYIYTKPGYVLTVNFLEIFTNHNGSAKISIHDGVSSSDRQLAAFSIFNSTKPQSSTTTRSNMFINFAANATTETYALIRITSGVDKWCDLNVTDTNVADNNGRGIAIENVRSRVSFLRTSVSHNNHVAGIHVKNGAGHVNVTESRIAFNVGDGINVTYAGGSTNISRSTLSSNKGFGLAVWYNETKPLEYLPFDHNAVIQYSAIFKNDLQGVLVGNFCRSSNVNITGNEFNMSSSSAIEILACWKERSGLLNLYIGHNQFLQNKKVGIRMRPAVNVDALIEYNQFINNYYGGILIKNDPLEAYEVLPSHFLIRNNEFYDNKGSYVVNLGLSPYSDVHKILFSWNYVRRNNIIEPYEAEKTSNLVPRSRVAAPIVVSSDNTEIFRNIIHNSQSQYEIGVHLQDQSKSVNCTFNWLGSSDEEKIYYRLFDRKERYNLAKIEYVPFLLHNSYPGATTIMPSSFFVPQFNPNGGSTVGGEVEGLENLRPGEYIVERDINIRPEGRLNLEPGVTLRFPPNVGIMVGGKLEAHGRRPNDILLTMREEVVDEESTTTLNDSEGPQTIPAFTKRQPYVRLIGGSTSFEGTLQVLVNNQWGTVCNYGWTQQAASIVCNQLGLVLNPNDWLLYRSDIPHSGTNDPILLTNVDCSDEDVDITKCKAQYTPDFENSCTHIQDVLMRCYPPHWAGMRMGALSETSHLQYITIQQAGILDYATNEFKPALQIDLSKHTLENVKLINNAHDGLGIIYSDIFAPGIANTVKNCELSDNKGSGVSFKQIGLRITGSKIENNKISGIRHDPVMSNLAQREFAGWFKPLPQIQPEDRRNKPLVIPFEGQPLFKIDEGTTKYIITQRVAMNLIDRSYTIMCNPGFVIGIQLLNPIHNRSTEEITIHDALEANTKGTDWVVTRDLNVFPTTSTSFGIIINYKSGLNALGQVVLALSVVRAPVQNIPNRIIKGPMPTLTLFNSRLKGNNRGIWATYYNRYYTELGDYYLRKSNESIHVVGCDISHNIHEAIYIDSPYWALNHSNISEITFVINSTLITDNGRGIYQFSRDLRNSTNLFHWKLNDNSVERNSFGGFEVSLPYVWDYNENFTHSVSQRNNTWRHNRLFFISIGGHFSFVNITDSFFIENVCRTGLISLQGMEKYMRISNNVIDNNYGIFMIEFKADSQSEILGDLEAIFIFNTIERNKPPAPETPSSVILFDGVQRVRVRRNLISNNSLTYSLVAGVRTAQLKSVLDVSENWWGTQDEVIIRKLIFDFDDWNDHSIAIYLPFLVENSFDSSVSINWEKSPQLSMEALGGRLNQPLTLYPRPKPYRVMSDLTVMPDVMLNIMPGVEIEFAPRVGLLILGTLIARGSREQPIKMRPLTALYNDFNQPIIEQSVRLCTPHNCTGYEGFVERYNATTQQWVPVCDSRFSERNAEVTCRQMQRDTLDIFVGHDRRYDLHPGDTSRIWSWHEPLQCTGEEKRLEDCEVRLNGQVYGHIHKCSWDDNFVFVRCGPRRLYNNWGGVRFANSEFEQREYENRIHDAVTHTTLFKTESTMEYVDITGAGLLHSEKSPGILAVMRSPELSNVNVTDSADHGISLIAPSDYVRLLFNSVRNNYGVGINIASITGEGRESGESSFTPLKEVLLPYRAFSLVDLCDPSKEIVVQERLIIYYIYDNRPINCVKIFQSAYYVKPFGFRLLQFNLYNATDRLDLYDGGLYNHSVKLITSLGHGSVPTYQKFVKTLSPRLSVRLVASAASKAYGFIAEIVTLPISAIGFNRDVQHNISYSVIAENKGGAIQYSAAGEVNPRLTIEKNQIRDNCFKMYGNFSSCHSSVHLDLQNTQNLHFRNNLVMNNQGGVYVRADSRSSATSLKGWIHNNLFADNRHKPALAIEGRQSSPYQQVTIYNNYWKGNSAKYNNIINLNQVVSNFTYNFVYGNKGSHILEVSGFDRVRLPIYQSTSHNGFYWNYASDPWYRSTVVAGTPGQHYVDNIFYNPDNDYEISTVNQSIVNVWQSMVDAKHNFWGFNETLAVMGRIRDRYDQANLLEVNFRPFLMNNSTILDVKCPPSWNLVGDTCYIYIGAPMAFFEAREFCRSANASMPYVMGNYIELYKFLKKQQETYQFYDRVWVQHIDKINQCTTFAFQRIEVDYCERLSPFICEMDPKVIIDALSWRTDIVAVAMIGSVLLLVLLIALLIVFWVSKSRHRQAQRLERRNSIRQSLNSVRSFGSSRAFGDMYRKGLATSTQSSPTLNKNGEYKKMAGSMDSIEKSQFNSSNEEDTQSYDIYEAHNPATTETINNRFDLSFRNQGFRDNSTFASQENSTWRTDDYNNSSTLPLNASLVMTDSSVGAIGRSDYQQEPDYQVHYERPKSSSILETNLDDSLPPIPTRAQSENLLETNFEPYPSQDMRSFQPLSKSQPLETAM